MALFSISSWDQVRFSKGNLQYNASTDTWRFAEKQTDHIGAENNQIADDNTNWIDLFGYGTSGWESGAEAYQPWSTASSYSKYLNQDLAGAYEEADWGAHNTISNGGNRAGMWRTLTKDEWSFLLNSRSASTVGGDELVAAVVCRRLGRQGHGEGSAAAGEGAQGGAVAVHLGQKSLGFQSGVLAFGIHAHDDGAATPISPTTTR